MSQHVAELLQRVEQLTTDDLAASHDDGLAAGRAAAMGIVDGTLRRVDFIAQCVVAARRPQVHEEDSYAVGFFSAVHAVLLRVPMRRG